MLSICIPAYTYVDYTAEAVKSILAQDVDVELVVVEDFDFLSSDHPEYARIGSVRDLLASDPRIKWISANVRRPIQQNWNFTVAQATRSFIKVMGADDRLRPGALARLAAIFQANPGVHLLGHLGVIIDQHGQVVRRLSPYVADRAPVMLQPVQALKLKLRQVARFREPACNVYSKEVWQAVGGYSEAFRFCFDVHFNARVMARVPSLLLSEELCELRRHQGSDGALLPATLALDELAALVQVMLDLLGASATASDRYHAQALVAYRVIELAAARSHGSLLQVLGFIWAERHRIPLSPRMLSIVLATLYRRASKGDVQKTMPDAQFVLRLD